MSKIIAFTGSKGSGKSTACKVLNQRLEKVNSVMIAGTLKKAICETFEFDLDRLDDQVYKEAELSNPIELDRSSLIKIVEYFGVDYNYDMHLRTHVGYIVYSLRELLQFIGTEVLHPIDPLIHIKAAEKELTKDGINVVTDLRFEQEFDYFNNSNYDFIPFYIQNFGAEAVAAGDTHPSETQLQNFKGKCTKITNNDDLIAFENLVAKTVQGIL